MNAYAKEHGSLEGWDAGRADHERGAARARVRHPGARGARGPGHGRERRATPMPARWPKARTGRRRSRAIRSSAQRGIPVLPDILTNAGGVTVSYFEWVQDLGRLFWNRDEIRAKLAEKLNDAFDRVWEIAHERSIPLRTAALVAGIRDVSAALEARGLYPSDARPTGCATRWCPILGRCPARARRGCGRVADAARGPRGLRRRRRAADRRRDAQDARRAGRRRGARPAATDARVDRRGAALHDRPGHPARGGVPLPRGARRRARPGRRGRQADRRPLAERAAAATRRGRATVGTVSARPGICFRRFLVERNP